MKSRIILFFISLSSVLFAAGKTAEEYRAELAAGTIDEYCFLTGEAEFFPISDETGKKVFTKKEKNLICEKVIKKEGECLEWETINQEYNIDNQQYTVYETQDFSSDLGAILGTIGAIGKIKDILGGWRGYCESGMWTDFSWAEDPLFWAGMALSYAAGSAADAAGETAFEGAVGASEDVAAASAEVSEAASDLADYQEFADAAAQTGDAAAIAEASQDVADAQAALDTASEGYNASIANHLSQTYGQYGGEAMAWINANKCFISAGIDAARGIRSYLSDGEDGEACDPVDEICEDTEENGQNNDPITLDETEYDALVEELIEADLDPDEIITILKEEDGIYTVVLTNPVQPNPMADTDALKEAQEKMKQVQAVIDGAVTTAKFVACYAGGVGGSGGADMGGMKISGEMIAKMGLNYLAGMVPPPYGQMLQIALKLVDSFKWGNTCTDLDFANEMTQSGARPVQASQNKALKAGMAHFVYEKCVYEFFGSCERTRYVYCNYDQFMSKILVEQMKIQLGKDWMHCSDISLDELKNIKFTECPDGTKNSRANPRWYPDGTVGDNREIVFFEENAPTLVENTTVENSTNSVPSNTTTSIEPYVEPAGMGNPDNPFDNPTATAQYQQQCIDYTEFIEKLKDQMGSEFDATQIDDMFKDMGVDAPDVSIDDTLTD